MKRSEMHEVVGCLYLAGRTDLAEAIIAMTKPLTSEQKRKRAEYAKKPEVKKRRAEYLKKPEVKRKRSEYAKKWRKAHPGK